jgi:hypothetical protein
VDVEAHDDGRQHVRQNRRDRKPRREYVPEGEIYTGPITHLPGEKLSGSAAKQEIKTEVVGGTPFSMNNEE